MLSDFLFRLRCLPWRGTEREGAGRGGRRAWRCRSGKSSMGRSALGAAAGGALEVVERVRESARGGGGSAVWRGGRLGRWALSLGVCGRGGPAVAGAGALRLDLARARCQRDDGVVEAGCAIRERE